MLSRRQILLGSAASAAALPLATWVAPIAVDPMADLLARYTARMEESAAILAKAIEDSFMNGNNCGNELSGLLEG